MFTFSEVRQLQTGEVIKFERRAEHRENEVRKLLKDPRFEPWNQYRPFEYSYLERNIRVVGLILAADLE